MHAPRTRRALAGLVVVTFLLAGCSSGSSSDGGDGSPVPDDGASAATEPGTAAPSSDLAALAFSLDDLADGEQHVEPVDSTTVSEGSYTMQFCDFPMPSEAARLERSQVQVLDDGFAAVASTEAVRYEPDTAIAAMNEIRTAFIDCPEDEAVDNGEGDLVTYTAMPIDEAELADLTSDHVGAEITATDADGEVTTSVLIFQRRGDVIIAIEGPDRDRALELANAAGARLAAAEGSEVGD